MREAIPVSKWREKNGPQSPVFIPQRFEKGEAFQFDWSSGKVEIAGVMQTIGVAHIRLCHSRMSYIACYPHQKLEMVMDAHIKAHNFFGGLCRRGIYDNLKSVVTRIGKGKEREFNPRMVELSSHYLSDLDACEVLPKNCTSMIEIKLDEESNDVSKEKLYACF